MEDSAAAAESTSTDNREEPVASTSTALAAQVLGEPAASTSTAQILADESKLQVQEDLSDPAEEDHEDEESDSQDESRRELERANALLAQILQSKKATRVKGVSLQDKKKPAKAAAKPETAVPAAKPETSVPAAKPETAVPAPKPKKRSKVPQTKPARKKQKSKLHFYAESDSD